MTQINSSQNQGKQLLTPFISLISFIHFNNNSWFSLRITTILFILFNVISAEAGSGSLIENGLTYTVYFNGTGSSAVPLYAAVIGPSNGPTNFSGTADILSSVTLSYNYIENGAAYTRYLTANVTTINSSAFESCSGLTNVNIPSSITTISDHAFNYCTSLNNVNIPNSVTTIGVCAFQGCHSLTSIIIPNSVTFLANSSFRDCTNLVSIKINNSMSSIEPLTFHGCYRLSNVDFGNNITSIGNNAFEGCSALKIVTIPNSVTSIAKEAFFKCSSLDSLSLGNSVLYIGEAAFRDCTSLTNVIIPNSVTTIARYVFYGCTNLKSIAMGNSVSSIGRTTFYDCTNLSKVIISDIDSWCRIKFEKSTGNPLMYAYRLFLNDNEITDLEIPSTLSTIENYSFYNGINLTSVRIPSTITSIGDYTFYYCSNINRVTCLAATPPTISSTTFTSNLIPDTLYVPFNSVELYRNHQYWGMFKNILPISLQPGDVDDDGEVSISDVTALVDMLLTGNITTNGATDVNGDGEVSISDVTALIDMLLFSN